jgi:HEAT repeat protein
MTMNDKLDTNGTEGELALLVAQLKGQDDTVRTLAWQRAHAFGAEAVKPLGALLTDSEMEVARAAKRALWNVVHFAGRPGAATERKAVSHELTGLLLEQPVAVRREVLWMLSEIGGAEEVKPVAALLSNPESREDARAVLERIPVKEALNALQTALTTAAQEFRPALANSLRVRGVNLSGYPSQKLVPTRAAPSPAKPL